MTRYKYLLALSTLILLPSWLNADVVRVSGTFTLTVNLPPCLQETKEPVHEETFEDGNKLEIFCTKDGYAQRLTLKDGTIGWTGKCPYGHGRNRIIKIFKGNLTFDTASGRHAFEKKRLLRTSWTSFDAPAPPDGEDQPQETEWQQGRKDSEWEWDAKNKNKLLQSKTTHDGHYIRLPNGIYHYEIKNERKTKSEETNLPGTRGGLQVAAREMSEGDGTGEYAMFAIGPDFGLSTPAPINSTINGEPITVTIRIDETTGDIEIQRVFAIESIPFQFNLEFPDEETQRVRYRLLDGPIGMSVGETDGVVMWTPPQGTSDAPTPTILIEVEYLEQSLRIHEFDLPVYNDQVSSPNDVFVHSSTMFESAIFNGNISTTNFLSEDTIEFIVNTRGKAMLRLKTPPSFATDKVDEGGTGFLVDSDFFVWIDGVPATYQELGTIADHRILRISVPRGKNISVLVSTKEGAE